MAVSDAAMIRSFMARLVDEAGGVDAAAALIGARLGSDVSKGTISKRMAGHLDWPLVEILALEKALCNPCVSRWIAGGVPEVVQAHGLMAAVATSAREHGEAISAALALGLGSGDVATAQAEIEQAGQALSALRNIVSSIGGA